LVKPTGTSFPEVSVRQRVAPAGALVFGKTLARDYLT